MVTAATPPKLVYRPDVVRNLALGLLLGLLLGTVSAWLYDTLALRAGRRAV